jgi:hypothetical protein
MNDCEKITCTHFDCLNCLCASQKMDVDKESTSPQAKFSNQLPKKNKLNQVQLRISNDLHEIKKNRMSTKMFNTESTEIIKDELNENFSTNITLISTSGSQTQYKVNTYIIT